MNKLEYKYNLAMQENTALKDQIYDLADGIRVRDELIVELQDIIKELRGEDAPEPDEEKTDEVE